MEKASKWDVVFLITGRPLPAMLDLASFAQNSGLRVLVVLFERGLNDLPIDLSSVNYDLKTIHVNYRQVSFTRFISLPHVYIKLRQHLRRNIAPNGVIITSSYDLLFLGYFLTRGTKYRLRHQVRDLHRLQLSGGMISNLVVRIEKLLLKRVELLTVSSPQFKVQYYKGIYSGKVVLLENVPSRATWTGFRRKERVDGVFCIGFIGIIRYIKSLEQLLEAVSQIVGEGGRMKVLIAGGTADGELLQRFRRYANFVHFSGPYEYNRDIKQLYSAVDLVYAVYDDGDRNCQLAMPNKFYEAIIARIPIIVAKDTYVASEVLRLGIGETVRTGDVDGLCDLLRGVDARHGWYDRALAGLKDLVPEQFFDSYERAAIETVCKQSL